MAQRILVLFALAAALASCTHRSRTPLNSIAYSLKSNVKSLDPAQAGDEYVNEVVPNIVEGLLQYHYLKRPLEVIPQLADGMPKVSKDGLTHTFKIKKGVRFQDSEVFPDGKGREVVAADFIYSWKRIADTRTKSDGFWIFDGKIKGINEWRDKLAKGTGKFEDPIEGLVAPDDHTLIVKLNKPYFQLYYVLTQAYAGVIPHEAVEKYGAEFLNHPVGTGPYKLDHWIRGNKVILSRNPNWHGETYPTEGEKGDLEAGLLADAGKPLPFVDQLIFYEIPEDQPRWLTMMKGAVDFSDLPKDNYDGAVEKDAKTLKPQLVKKGIRLFIAPNADIVYISMNQEDPILGKNVNLRRALALAYNTVPSLEKFYNNRGIVAQSPIPPGLDGYDPNFKNPWKEFNLEKAKEYLAKAGYPGGKGLPPIEYSTTSSSTSNQMAEYLEQQFAPLGIKIVVVANSWPQFTDRIRTKKSQIFGIAWRVDYPDPQNMFQLLYGPNSSPGPNNSNFNNPEFNKLYEESLTLPPGPARTKIYQKLRDIFVDQLPWIPTVHRLDYRILHSWVKNYKHNPIMHGDYKYMRVDVDNKREMKEKL